MGVALSMDPSILIASTISPAPSATLIVFELKKQLPSYHKQKGPTFKKIITVITVVMFESL